MVFGGEEEGALNALIPADSDGVDVVQRALARVRETYFLSLTLEQRAFSLRQAQRIESMARAAGDMDQVVLEAKRLIVEMKRSIGMQVPAMSKAEAGAMKGKGKGQKAGVPETTAFSKQQLYHCRKLAEVPDKVVNRVFREARMDEGWRVPSERDIIKAARREEAKEEGEAAADHTPPDYTYPVPPITVTVPGEHRWQREEGDLLNACTSLANALAEAAHRWSNGPGKQWDVAYAEGVHYGRLTLEKGSVTLAVVTHTNTDGGGGRVVGQEA